MNDHQFIMQDAEQTTAALLSAVDRLERLAMVGSNYVRPCRAELIESSDRLATLVIKILAWDKDDSDARYKLDAAE